MFQRLAEPFVVVAALTHFSLSDAYHNYLVYRRVHARGWLKCARCLETANRLLTGADISACATIGGNLDLPHPSGVVIGGLSVIGDSCTIYQQVTLGYRGDGDPSDSHPILGDGVLVGAGAKLLGPIRIGSGARIGANAVVIHDVPDDALAVGIPARVRRRATDLNDSHGSAGGP